MDVNAWPAKLDPRDRRLPISLWSEHQAAIEQAVRFHAGTAREAPTLRELDRDDLQQELRLAFWQELWRFDPRRASLPTFLDRVARSTIVSLIRQATAHARDVRRRGPSLDAPVRPVDRRERRMLAADVPDQLRPYARPSDMIDSGRSLERRVCFEDWVASLPDSERTIADLLTSHSEHKVARLLGLSRRKVREQIERLRRSYGDRRESGNP